MFAAGVGQWWLSGMPTGGAVGGGSPGGSEAPGGTPGAARETRALPGPTEGGPAAARTEAGSPAMPLGRVDAGGPRVATGIFDHHGNETTIACATCHATREPDRANGVGGKTPQTFHQGLAYAHGGQSCLSCHHAEDYDSLRLADGRRLAFADARQLCAQCHGPQTRDYEHGSHGGMRGYWDKAKGERVRNTCLDCHDAHAPAYPAWTPVFPPSDAAARQQAEREDRAGHAVRDWPGTANATPARPWPGTASATAAHDWPGTDNATAARPRPGTANPTSAPHE